MLIKVVFCPNCSLLASLIEVFAVLVVKFIKKLFT